MAGTPFNALKKACTDMAGSIFGEDESNPEENMFEQMHTIFYGSDLSSSTTNRKSEYLATINSAKPSGRTNFVACYEKIMQMISAAEEGT